MTASCANEVVDAQLLPPAQRLAVWQRVVQRYGRALGLTLKDVQEAAASHLQAEPSDKAPGGPGGPPEPPEAPP